MVRFVAVLLVLMALGPLAFAAPVPCPFYGLNPGAPVWNGQVVLDSAYAQALAATGAGSVRVDFRLDGASSWDGPKLAQYDGIVDAVLAAGLEPLGLLAYEGVIGGQSQWNDDPDQDGYNAYVESFASTTEILFAHFQGRIRRWEIWNEPDCWSNPNYASDPQNAGCSYLLPRVLAKLLAESYVRNEAAITSGAVSLVSGGLFAHDIGGSYSPAIGYLTELYGQSVWDWMEQNMGRRYPWDGLGYHLYVEQGQATDGVLMGQYLDDVRALANAEADSAPFHVTEFGWTTAGVSEAVQAANLTTAFDLFAARPDITAAYWFSYRDAPNLYFGLTDSGGTPKASLAAMQAVTADCTAATGGGGGAGGAGAGGAGTGGAGAQGGVGGAGASAGHGAGGQAGGGAAGASATNAGAASASDDCACLAAGAPTREPLGAALLLLLGAGLLARRREAHR